MRNEIVTPFWKNALESLPERLRARYAPDIAAAERWELRIDALVQTLRRFKNRAARAKPLGGPRAA